MRTRFALTMAWLAACLTAGPAQAFKVYIFCDMEGCSGVTGSEFIFGARADEGKRAMEGDINACITGCVAAGATEIVVRDGHGGGTNVDPSKIDARARLIQGATPGVRFKDLEGAAALILLGYHAMALTANGVLAHSYSSASIQRMRLNGREVGEIGVDASIAAEHGVPVALVTGDDKVAAETKAWIPGARTAQVKRGTGWQSAEIVPVDEARALIRKATEEVLRRRADLRPAAVSHPATMEWEYLPKGSLRTHNPDFKPIADPRCVKKTSDTVEFLLVGKP